MLVAKAPDWKVTVFRKDDKIFYSCTLKQFEKSGLVSDSLFTRRTRTIIGQEEQLKLAVYSTHAKRRVTAYKACEYFPGGMLATPQVESILYAAYKLPTCGGIPLRYVQTTDGKDWVTGLKLSRQQALLSTQLISEANVPSNFYSAPSGYTLSKSLREVLISKATRTASGEDGILMLDIGKPTQRHSR